MAEELKPSYNFSNDRLNELKSLFPEAFEDGNFNVDALKDLIGEYGTDNNVKEHFGLNWVGKMDARKIASIPPTGTLKPCQGEGTAEDSTGNIFIEGENLEVLKILRKSYSEKIRMIYIDPPYNTGYDFVYKDDFSDSTEEYLRKAKDQSDEELLVSNPKTSGKYHSNWLSFLYPRIRIAKDLLEANGLIFVSIDDNEVHNLRSLMNEIFGEENFVEQIIWKNKYGAGAKTVGFISVHEYILCYSKTPVKDIEATLDEEGIKAYNKKDENFEVRGGYFTQPLMTTSMDDRPNLQYSVFHQGVEIKPVKQWVWSKERLEKAIAQNEVVFNQKTDGSFSVRSKQYLKDEKGNIRKGKPISLWNGPFTQEGTNDITEILGENIFGFTKPVNLIKELFSISVNNIYSNDGIYLDFFAGSGTSAQAIFELNKKDNGSRKIICIQIDEKCSPTSTASKMGINKISDITLKRIKEAIKLKNYAEGIRKYKLASSNIYKWQDFDSTQGSIFDFSKQLELSLKSPIRDNAKELDVITEIILQKGFSLNSTVDKVGNSIFEVVDETIKFKLIIALKSKLEKSDIDSLQMDSSDHFICIDNSFESDSLKMNLEARCNLFTI